MSLSRLDFSRGVKRRGWGVQQLDFRFCLFLLNFRLVVMDGSEAGMVLSTRLCQTSVKGEVCSVGTPNG